MKTHLIMLSEPILVSDEEIKDNDWYLDDRYNIRPSFTPTKEYWDARHDYRKIIAGVRGLPLVDLSALSDEDCKKIGWVDVEGLAEDNADDETFMDTSLSYSGFYKAFIKGFKAAQSLNDKKFSAKEVKGAMLKLIQSIYGDIKNGPEGRIRLIDCERKASNIMGLLLYKSEVFEVEVEITNNSIKVINVL